MASSASNTKKSALSLPPGYKFSPSDEILLAYLSQRILGGTKLPVDIIPTIDNLDKLNPDQIPFDKFKEGAEGEWIFFTTRPKTGLVSTQDGYWQPTTIATEIKLDNMIIGFKQILTFQWGIAADQGEEQSNFLIHEYKLNNKEEQNFVVCRVRNVKAFTSGQDDGEDTETITRDEEDSEDDEKCEN